MPPIEGHYIHKIINEISEYFNDMGWRIEGEVVDKSKPETKEGSDAIFVTDDKVFGIQVKRTDNKTKPVYDLDEKQHSTITRKNKILPENKWVLYGFVEPIGRQSARNTLDRTIFSDGSFPYNKTINLEDVPKQMRWGDVAKKLEDCPIGVTLTDEETVSKLSEEVREIIDDYTAMFAINPKRKAMKAIVSNAKLLSKKFFKNSNIWDKNIISDNVKTLEMKEEKHKCPLCGKLH